MSDKADEVRELMGKLRWWRYKVWEDQNSDVRPQSEKFYWKGDYIISDLAKHAKDMNLDIDKFHSLFPTYDAWGSDEYYGDFKSNEEFRKHNNREYKIGCKFFGIDPYPKEKPTDVLHPEIIKRVKEYLLNHASSTFPKSEYVYCVDDIKYHPKSHRFTFHGRLDQSDKVYEMGFHIQVILGYINRAIQDIKSLEEAKS